MTEELRTTLHRIADSAPPLPVGDDLWQRGRAARRRGQALAIASVLALIVSVGGIATLTATSDREARTASNEVQGGAIPSRIEDPGDLALSTDLAVGRASVAFVDHATDVVVVTAEDGRYHALALPEAPVLGPVRLSPDGNHLAYTYRQSPVRAGELSPGTAILDLRTGDVHHFPAVTSADSPVGVSSISWSADSSLVAWWGDENRSFAGTGSEVRTRGTLGMIDVGTGDQSTLGRVTGGETTGAISINDSGWITLATPSGVSSWVVQGDGDGGGTSSPLARDLPGGGPGASASRQPTGRLTAVGTSRSTRAVPFVDEEGEVLTRPLARDLYPSGAQVTPLGWSVDSLLLAQVDGPAGSYVEGRHLALLTSPDRPDSEWTYRIVMRDIADVAELSIAVDLIPDLDGTSSQQLTHDFGATPIDNPLAWTGIELSLLIGLGVAAAIAVLLGLRWLWRRNAW